MERDNPPRGHTSVAIGTKAPDFTPPMLSDFNRTVIRQYGVVLDSLAGLKELARREVFLIDESGVVRYSEVLDEIGNQPNYTRRS
jgi:peroxiredoxin